MAQNSFDPEVLNNLIALEAEARQNYLDFPCDATEAIYEESSKAVSAAIKGLGKFIDSKLDEVEGRFQAAGLN